MCVWVCGASRLATVKKGLFPNLYLNTIYGLQPLYTSFVFISTYLKGSVEIYSKGTASDDRPKVSSPMFNHRPKPIVA